MKKTILSVLASLLLACGGGSHRPPQPPTPPTPPPDPHVPVCSPPDLVFGCWHKPPGQDWQYIPPKEEPPAPVQCVPPDSNDSNWDDPIPRPGDRPDYPEHRSFDPNIRSAILSCMNEIGEACGRPYVDTLKELGSCMRARGFQAGFSADALAVLVPNSKSVEHIGGLWEEWHANHSETGCWNNGPGAFKATWPFNAQPPPCGTSTPTPEEPEPPAPNPPTTDTCGEPVPPPLARFRCGRHNQGYDCSPLVYSPGGEFCKAIGLLNPDNRTGRLFCVPRPEGHPEREACETFIVGGSPKWNFPEGWDCWGGWQDNPYLAICNGGARPPWLEICNASGTSCTRFDG